MIKGSYVALVTPFKNRDIDYNSLEKLLNFHLKNNTDGILLCGTTGEAPALAGDEKENFIRFCTTKINRKIPLMVGSGTNNINHTISATIKAKDLGADSALVITPYYNKPTQSGMYLFFKTVANEVDIPIVIYNVPGRTGVNINSDTVIKLVKECPNIVGIKEASGNLVQASEVIRHTHDNFSLLSGEDALNYPLMCCGGKGVISVTANVVPAQVHKLVKYCTEKKYDEALKIHFNLIEINKAMFYETNPIPVKEALYLMGYIQKEYRLPLCELSDINTFKLKEILKNYELIK